MSKKGLPFIITLPIFNSFSLRYQINQKLIPNTFLEVGSSDLPLQIEGYFLLQCVTSKRRQYMVSPVFKAAAYILLPPI